MNNVTDLHPPLSTPKRLERDGEIYINVPGVIKMAKEGDTPQCRALVRFYSAEWRALEGKPLTTVQRESDAFRAACQRMTRRYGFPAIDWRDLP